MAEPSALISVTNPSVAPPWLVIPIPGSVAEPAIIPGSVVLVVPPATYKFPVAGLIDKTKQASLPPPPKNELNIKPVRLGVNFNITPSCLPPPNEP